MKKDQFFRLKRNDQAWKQVCSMIAYRKFRQLADDIEATSLKEVKNRDYETFKKQGDPEMLNLVMSPRK